MCGINGFISLHDSPVRQAEQHIAAMNNRLAHRGPDDSGQWSDMNRNIFLGHRRLSIIDLSASGHQPMISEKGNVIVFNGEIYNYKELKDRFFPGYQFRSTSDTEILLLLYEKLGSAFLEHLNGMFAFAIWDKGKEELFIARDRAGKKPFYYSVQNGIFAFSSELKALLELPWIKKETDPESLYHFLTYNLMPPPLTMFRGISKMHPAHLMRVDKTGILEYRKYWDVNYEDLSGRTEEQLKQEIFTGLQNAVDYRMVSDVPVGAFLSGGVDSSAIVALMARQAGYPVKTYSIGFEGQPDYDELAFASQVSRKFGTDHYERIVSPADIIDFLPAIVDVFDEPLADATCIPLYFLSQKARENGTIVVMTGDGSDELFAGYRSWQRYIRFYPRYHKYLKLPGFIRKSIAGLFGQWDEMSPSSEIMQRAAANQEFFWGGAKSFKESTKRNFLSDDFNEECRNLNSYSVIKEFKDQFDSIPRGNRPFSDTDWMCYLGYKFNVPNYYLHRTDRLGMAHSIEIRCPFLDTNFVNLALSVDGSMKSRGYEPKYILKKSLEKILPAEVLYRKKMGFCVPLKEWAGDLMLDYIETNLLDFCKDNPQFDYRGLKKQAERLKKGDKGVSNTLWTIYFLMTWFNRWMNDTHEH
ncbi:MAG TPA: asparagine synthase (glutamine-hydrolyzing) [Bacteroidia bacterium]|nr:asparagine synthase (glutamine-hydrolyzing) [Bacteroidia bacterium]